MSTSTKIDNKKKDILILGKGQTQGSEHSLTAEKMNSINFTKKNKEDGYLFVIGTEIYKFKAKHSKIVATSLSLGKISKDWSTYDMNKAGLCLWF